MPEVAARHHLELVDVGRRRRARPAPASRSTTSTSSPSPRGRASSARCSSASATAKALAAARDLPLAPVDHLQGHVAANFLGPGPVRAAVPVPDRLRRPHAAGARRRTTTASTVLGATLDDAAGEAFDKGARCSASASRAGRRSAAGRRAATRTRSRFPTARRRRRAGLLVRGRQDRAALHAARRLGEARRRGADLAASYEHAIVEQLVHAHRARAARDRAAAPGDRRRRGRQRPAARAAGASSAPTRCTCRRASCAPTTRR